MTKLNRRERLLASSIFCTAALAAVAAPAAAQTTASSADVQEIVVTGSRIPQTNYLSVSPVQPIGAEDFRLQGRTDTSELLYTLPQVTFTGNADLSSTSNPLSNPGGVATVNLRGLGPQRTLVLVDGRRLGIGDPNTGNPNPAPDINQVPTALIDRVEILTGGASATYGSDAVAGVVNFIMKRRFTGVQADVQWGTYQHTNENLMVQELQRLKNIPIPKKTVWDGQSRDASLVMGLESDDGKAYATLYGVYHDQDPVAYSRRDFTNCQVNVTVTATASTPACAGSSNSNIFYSADGSFSQRYAVVGNTFAPYSSTANTSPAPVFNANPYESLQHGDKRYQAGFFAGYEFTPAAEMYADFSYMKDRADTVVGPSALFQGSGSSPNAGFLVNCNNPFLSAQQRTAIGCSTADITSGATKDLLIGRRNIEGGGRTFINEHENYRGVLGLKGKLSDAWSYDVYGSRYYTGYTQQSANYLSIARIQNALLVTTNAQGQPVCISGGSCVPYNIFRQGAVTTAMTDYLATGGFLKGSTTESIVSGSISGDLTGYGLKSPGATDGLSVAFGAEYRKDHLEFAPDEASKSGDLSGAGGASTAIDESLSVKELFGEFRAPLVQGRPLFDELILDAGYRYSDYSTGVSAHTYKAGAIWAPIADFRIRGSYQRAIRAPNILDLYSPQSVTNTSDVSEDPCSGTAATPATASLAQCLRTGVTAAQYGNGGSTNTIPQCPSGQCAVLQGGNPLLDPEKADTWSIGFTARPTFIPRFTASVDFYKIKIKDQISQIPLDVVLDKCLTTGDLCNLIVRGPGNGLLFGTSVTGGGYITGTQLNIASAVNTGVDLQLAYSMPMGDMGSMNVSFNGSYLIDQKSTPVPGDPTYDCAGLYGPTCDSVNPKFRSTARATWQTPWDMSFTVGWRHLSKVFLETNSDDPTLTNGRFDTFDNRIEAKDYIDLAATWDATRFLTFRVGVNNVLDIDPPLISSLIAGTGSPNGYPAYDLLGRKFFVALTARY